MPARLRLFLLACCLAVVPAGAVEPSSTGAGLLAPPAAEPSSHDPLPALPPDRLVLALDLSPGATFGGLVQPWGLPAESIRQAALDHHDLARLHPAQELALELVDGAEGPVAVRYAFDEDHTLIVRLVDDAWTASVEAVHYEVRQVPITLEITSSLWEAGMSAGLRAIDLVRLARIFEYELDFNTEIRQGARLGLVADVLSADGRPDKLGTIHALRFLNDGKVHEMVRFEVDGRETYFHPDGTSTVKAFLRSPLEFSRVTSGFNPRRFHPILKVARPHNGTDFGAPTGTPVRAVADGVVVSAGPAGGHGNFVKIKHDRGYETSYSHLSAILVKKGAKVRQGAVIGRVGSTGLATGPHLHFQMWKNGRFVDPLREDLPRTLEMPAHLKDAFREQVARWLPRVPVEGPQAKR